MAFFEPPPPPPEPPRREPTQPWWGPSANTLGEVVALNLVVGESERAVVAVPAVTVDREGLVVSLAAQVDLGEDDDWLVHPFAFIQPHRRRGGEGLPDELLRFGVAFADGRRATNLGELWRGLGEGQPPEGPVLRPNGGGGGGGRWRQELWLWPLPPDGPLTFVCEWPAFGIGETRAEIDTEPIRSAAGRVRALWPERATSGAFVGATGSYQIMSRATELGRGRADARRSPAADRVIARAGELAAELGHELVGGEDLLLALAEEPDGDAATVLREVGVLDQVRERLRHGSGPESTP